MGSDPLITFFSWDGQRTTVFLAPSGYQGFPIPATRQKTVIAEPYQGKRFNSPNDLVVARGRRQVQEGRQPACSRR